MGQGLRGPLLTRRSLIVGGLALLASPSLPVPLWQAVAMPNDTQDWTSPGTAWQSVADPLYYAAIVDHRRLVLTNVENERYFQAQVGRTLYRTDWNEATLQWTNAQNTIATDTARFIVPPQSLKLTTAAVAGSQAIARKFFQLPADQGTNTFPLVIVEGWFQLRDTVCRDFQVFIRPDDGTVKYEMAMRFHVQQAGVAQNHVQFLDSTGTFQTADTYAIAVPAGNVSDDWHHWMMAIDYKQGAGGYCKYHLLKFDDDTLKGSGVTVSGHVIGSGGVRQSSVDLLCSADTAAGTSVNVGPFIYCDLSNAFQL